MNVSCVVNFVYRAADLVNHKRIHFYDYYANNINNTILLIMFQCK